MSRKKIFSSACIIICGMIVVFATTRIKPKASSLTTGKDGLELVTPGTDTSSEGSLDLNKNEGLLEFDKGTVSHVCYMYIDKKGNISFDSKDDSVGNKTCAKLPYKKDCSLVVFIKQSTSGMIWCEKELSNDMINKVVETIKKNDKSYKGHNAVAFGNGEHMLTYKAGKKQKAVKYCFKSNTLSTTQQENDANSDSNNNNNNKETDKTKNNNTTSNDNDKVTTDSNCNGKLEYKKGTVSHVCYMYIDQKGNVIYDSKDDSAGNKTCVSLPRKDGYTLVVFIKQSTSGMIWCEKELSDNMVNKVVDTVKKNDKSYKGHNAVCFGDGKHNLNYKNDKNAEYNFNCGSNNNNNDTTNNNNNNSGDNSNNNSTSDSDSSSSESVGKDGLELVRPGE